MVVDGFSRATAISNCIQRNAAVTEIQRDLNSEEGESAVRQARKSGGGITEADAMLFFGGVRDGESKERFKQRVLQHLEEAGIFGEDGKLAAECRGRSGEVID
jgi:hypothetical protein